MAEDKDDYGAAQGLVDDFKKVAGVFTGKTAPVKRTGSSTDSGKLPSQWEEANKRAAEEQKRGTEIKSGTTVSGGKSNVKRARKGTSLKR